MLCMTALAELEKLSMAKKYKTYFFNVEETLPTVIWKNVFPNY